MDGDLPQINFDDDLPRPSGSLDGSGRLGDDQIGGESQPSLSQLERRQWRRRLRLLRQQPLQLPQPQPQPQLLRPPWLSLPQLLQFLNRGPASAAVNGGELMIGGIQLYGGGVGLGDGIGNGFGANDQEVSSASINGTTYERASDYFRHVRTENGEVHFHMNSFVNVDGRVYNLTQERHLNNQGSTQLINKVMLAITGQTGIALMVAALNDRSSPFPPAFYVVVACNTIGFITSMTSMVLRNRKPWASGVLAKVGAVAGSSAIILAMGMSLHMRHIWAFLFLCIITAVAVLFGQT